MLDPIFNVETTVICLQFLRRLVVSVAIFV